MRRLPAFVLAAPLVAVALLATALPALADHVTVPQVTGQDVARAVRAIERAGLQPVVVEVADAPEGRVVQQDPPAGTALERGSPVEIRTGVLIRIETRVPSVIGWEVERAQQALSGAYLVEVEEVQVLEGRDGTVVETVPAAGARHPFRGVLVLRVAVVPQRVPVPAVQGLTFDQAESVLVGAGLVAAPTFVPAWGVPPWSVVNQAPPAGTPVELGSEVRIAVAQPGRRDESVRVPTLFGMTEADAARVLRAIGLSAEFLRERSRFPEGRVFLQEPAAGARVRVGTAIQVRVSHRGGGPRPRDGVPVPTLVGLDVAAARIALVQAGFQGQLDLVEAPNEPVDHVIAQEPAPGTPLALGSRVLLRTPIPTTTPDVVGRSRAEASALLAAAGLQAGFEAPMPDPRAVVAAQEPEAGTRIARGTTVRLILAVNPGMRRVRVPNVVGRSAVEAQATLASLGLTAAFEGPPVVPAMLMVVEQDPPAGAQVPRGATVRLRVVRRR